MARRIEIELTSARPDGTWAWRAAGALNPRGALDAGLLYNGAKAGDVVRAEAEFGIDGITVISVEAPRARPEADPNRIELIEPPPVAAVTTQLTGNRGRSGFDRGTDRGAERRRPSGPSSGQPGRSTDRGTRGPLPGSDGPRVNGNGNGRGPRPSVPRPAGDGTGHEPRPDRAERKDRPERPDRPERGGPPDRADRTEHPDRAGRPERADRPERTGAPARSSRPTTGPGRGGPGRAGGRPGTETGRHMDGEGEGRGTSAPRQRRLSPGNTHRNAMLEGLPAEQRPIAQQLLRGGIPAVRTALHFEREKAREEGRPEPSTEGVLALAESLVSKVKAAEWRDRAEAAVKAGDDLVMRDLRSLVNGSDVARDEASRDLVIALREMLENRVEGHRVAWANEVASNLDDGHIVRALRLSSHPPDPAARFSAELATRLRDAAGTALASETPPDRWLAILQAVVESPVRRTVKPQGLPHDPSSELLETARQQCGRVPALAPLLGISVPPPPGPARPGLPIKPPPRHTTRSARPARPPARPAGAPARAPRAASPHSAAAVPEAAPAELSVGAPGEVAAEPTADVAAEPAAEAEVTAEPAAEAEVSEVEVTEPEVVENGTADVTEPPIALRALD
ncbi:MAG: hypothetical protein ACLQVK_24165 [Acidimicrobiales bacterium]